MAGDRRFERREAEFGVLPVLKHVPHIAPSRISGRGLHLHFQLSKIGCINGALSP